MDVTVKNMATIISSLRQSSHHATFMKRAFNIIDTEKSTGSETVTRHGQHPSTYLERYCVSVTLVRVDSMRKNSDLCNEGPKKMLTHI